MVATGKIEPLVKVEVKSKASGIVEKILADYGDHVKAGQVLVELDKEQLRARVAEARANLQAAQAAVESAQATYERNKVDAEGPDLPFLKSTVERNRKLAADGLVSASILDDAEKAYQLGLNKQMSAQRYLAVSRAEIARTKAQVAQMQAALDSAEEDLRNSTIVSPMDGLVLSRDVEVGDAVSSILILGSQATLVMTLGDVSEVYVKGKVDEADISKVYMGQRARIVVESLKDKKFEGKVTKISPMGVEKDNVTTFEVKVSIQNPTGELKANMTANAEIIHGREAQRAATSRSGGGLRQRPSHLCGNARPRLEDRQAEAPREARNLQRRQDRADQRIERGAAGGVAIRMSLVTCHLSFVIGSSIAVR